MKDARQTGQRSRRLKQFWHTHTANADTCCNVRADTKLPVANARKYVIEREMERYGEGDGERERARDEKDRVRVCC